MHLKHSCISNSHRDYKQWDLICSEQALLSETLEGRSVLAVFNAKPTWKISVTICLTKLFQHQTKEIGGSKALHTQTLQNQSSFSETPSTAIVILLNTQACITCLGNTKNSPVLTPAFFPSAHISSISLSKTRMKTSRGFSCISSRGCSFHCFARCDIDFEAVRFCDLNEFVGVSAASNLFLSLFLCFRDGILQFPNLQCPNPSSMYLFCFFHVNGDNCLAKVILYALFNLRANPVCLFNRD